MQKELLQRGLYTVKRHNPHILEERWAMMDFEARLGVSFGGDEYYSESFGIKNPACIETYVLEHNKSIHGRMHVYSPYALEHCERVMTTDGSIQEYHSTQDYLQELPEWVKKIGYLGDLFIEDRIRGKGLGRKIVHEGISQFRTDHKESVNFFGITNNPRVISIVQNYSPNGSGMLLSNRTHDYVRFPSTTNPANSFDTMIFMPDFRDLYSRDNRLRFQEIYPIYGYTQFGHPRVMQNSRFVQGIGQSGETDCMVYYDTPKPRFKRAEAHAGRAVGFINPLRSPEDVKDIVAQMLPYVDGYRFINIFQLRNIAAMMSHGSEEEANVQLLHAPRKTSTYGYQSVPDDQTPFLITG